MTYKEALEGIKSNAISPKSQNTALVQVVAKSPNTTKPIAKSPEIQVNKRPAVKQEYTPLSGTLFRISIPSGTALNLLNLFEVATPDGMNLVVRLPLFSDMTAAQTKGTDFMVAAMDAIKAAGGVIKVLQ